ncbi:helix-turn-helix domain-containing protein [Alcanivorax sp. 1008]|uniref:helix-turn-helix domain-containing protein n=1 Tax=Alcanivorax sp. 1008 TaxID=2816853 RepID=UPI001D54A730|nr:helix-turn-helix domain-containing protein [Alcanivorax sp. 1008]
MVYTHVTQEERCQIYALCRQGESQKSIAEQLGRLQQQSAESSGGIAVCAVIGHSKRTNWRLSGNPPRKLAMLKSRIFS